MTTVGTRWQLRLLGGFELSDGSSQLHRLPTRAMLLILARLALAPQRDHPREELIDLLWPDATASVGRNRLRQALSSLRSVLEPAGDRATPMLLADRQFVRLAPGAIASDVQALRAALRHSDAAAAATLYGGELLPGHFDEWVLEERRLLDEATARLCVRPPARGDPPQPLPKPQPVAATQIPTPHWLPTYVTRSVGYEVAGAALARAVLEHRLVLLRGPGGAGKTRLAVEVARSLAGPLAPALGVHARFDAVMFVPLVGVTSAAGMAEATLRAMRAEGSGGAADAISQLEPLLAGRRLLLVLDNFEQLVEVARDLLSRWLARLPALHLLVTSRRVLGLDSEHEQALESLVLPSPDGDLQEHALNPAVALFVDRARAVRSSFHLTASNHRQVATLVCLLHGLPLAIELAAARLRSIAMSDMQAMLESAVHGQPEAAFALLSRSGPRGGDDPRHASMQHVMGWSFAQLSVGALALLDALSVCAGGATLQAAAAISGLALHHVATHVDELVASSVAYAPERHTLDTRADGDEPRRYYLFEPVREYALMKLGALAQAQWRERHWRWIDAWSVALGNAPSLSEFRDEVANLLAAWHHAAVTGQHASVLRSALACARALDDVTLPPSALALLQHCSTQVADDAELCARAHALLAEQCFESGQSQAASVHAEQALRQMPATSPYRADALHVAARVRLRVHNDTATTGALVDEALRLAEQQARIELQARLLALRGVLVTRRDRDHARKVALDTQALSLWRAGSSPARVSEGLVNLALALGFVHRVPEQLALLEQARVAAAAHGQQRLLAFVHSVSGYALADLRRWDESAASYRACLQIAWTHSAWREWFYALWNLPRTLAHQRQPVVAVLVLAFADRFAFERFGQLGWSDLRERRRTRRLVRAQIGAEREAALWQQGRGLSMAEAMRLASSLG